MNKSTAIGMLTGLSLSMIASTSFAETELSYESDDMIKNLLTQVCNDSILNQYESLQGKRDEYAAFIQRRDEYRQENFFPPLREFLKEDFTVMQVFYEALKGEPLEEIKDIERRYLAAIEKVNSNEQIEDFRSTIIKNMNEETEDAIFGIIQAALSDTDLAIEKKEHSLFAFNSKEGTTRMEFHLSADSDDGIFMYMDHDAPGRAYYSFDEGDEVAWPKVVYNVMDGTVEVGDDAYHESQRPMPNLTRIDQLEGVDITSYVDNISEQELISSQLGYFNGNGNPTFWKAKEIKIKETDLSETIAKCTVAQLSLTPAPE